MSRIFSVFQDRKFSHVLSILSYFAGFPACQVARGPIDCPPWHYGYTFRRKGEEWATFEDVFPDAHFLSPKVALYCKPVLFLYYSKRFDPLEHAGRIMFWYYRISIVSWDVTYDWHVYADVYVCYKMLQGFGLWTFGILIFHATPRPLQWCVSLDFLSAEACGVEWCWGIDTKMM